MDENNYEAHNEHHHHHHDCFMCRHPLLKHILTGLLTFLGAFAAFYVVTDWHYKKMLDPVFQLKKMDRIMQKEEQQMHKMAERDWKKGMLLEHKAGQILHIEKDKNSYKIVIDLKPFDNDEKNVEVTTDNKTLTIVAAGETKKHNKEELIRFTQSFIFPDNANLEDIHKFKDGKKYVIVVPIDED